MTTNVGTIDRALRVIIGIALLWFAIASTSSYSWIGWIGVIPLITALVGICPLYSILGVSTCPVKRA